MGRRAWRAGFLPAYARCRGVSAGRLPARLGTKSRSGQILAKHEVHIERWLVAEDMGGNGFDKPDELVVRWFRDAAAKAAFENDPDFKTIAELRDRAAKQVTITAKSVYGS